MRLLQPSGAVREGRSRLTRADPRAGFEINLERKSERMICYSRAERFWSLHDCVFFPDLRLALTERWAFGTVLVRFTRSRLLHRLSVPEHRDRFVLKRSLLVTIWIGDDNRLTREPNFRHIMGMEGADGLVFTVKALSAGLIREELEYGGVRLRTATCLEWIRILFTIDIGFGDAMA
jgi:hypothetical protein